MTLQKDSEGSEKKYLYMFADLKEKRVLEIGCGEGRLTWRYAKVTHSTVAIDVDRDALRVATIDRPSDLANKVLFSEASSIYLPFSKARFDIAVLAWSF